jgi:hypothetical protein
MHHAQSVRHRLPYSVCIYVYVGSCVIVFAWLLLTHLVGWMITWLIDWRLRLTTSRRQSRSTCYAAVAPCNHANHGRFCCRKEHYLDEDGWKEERKESLTFIAFLPVPKFSKFLIIQRTHCIHFFRSNSFPFCYSSLQLLLSL